MEHSVVRLVWLWCHECRLVLVGIELLALDAGIEFLHSMLLQCGHQDALGHGQAAVQVDQILVIGRELLLGNGVKGAIEVVDALKEVLGEALQREVAGSLDLALCLLLKVAVFSNLSF